MTQGDKGLETKAAPDMHRFNVYMSTERHCRLPLPTERPRAEASSLPFQPIILLLAQNSGIHGIRCIDELLQALGLFLLACIYGEWRAVQHGRYESDILCIDKLLS